MNEILPTFDPQPARGRFKESLWADPGWWAEHKLHGCRYLLYSDGRLMSRHVSVKGTGFIDKIDRTPHLREAAKLLPRGTILDGEVITHPFCTVRDVTSIMNSGPEEAIYKQHERGWVTLQVFDLPFAEGHDLQGFTLQERRRYLEEILSKSLKYVELNPIIQEAKKEYCDHIMSLGGEGVILKWRHATYGQQSKWVKVKRSETFDVFIIGYKDASEVSTKVNGETSPTKFAVKGWIGAVEMGMIDAAGDVVSVGFVSGFSEDERAFLSAERNAYLGRVIEVEAQSQLPSGKFEHPRFLRFRDDKAKEECVWTP